MTDHINPIAGKPRCLIELDGGRLCQTAVPRAGMRCHRHAAAVPADLVAKLDLPEGMTLPQAFPSDPERQLALHNYVAEVYRDYTGLNTGTDLRQILVAGVAYVRLVFEGLTMEARDVDALSKVVDRHLRNLKATPKEIAAGEARGIKSGKELGALAAGVGVGALLERVRSVLTPSQLLAMATGKVPRGLGLERLDQADAGSVEISQDEDQAPDPFGD